MPQLSLIFSQIQAANILNNIYYRECFWEIKEKFMRKMKSDENL